MCIRVRIAPTALLSLAVVLGCGTDAAARAGDSEPARRLVGQWDARFHVNTLPLGRVTDARRADVIGAVALLPNHGLEDVPGLATPTNVGTFDVDFSALGFDVRDPSRAPAAAARAVGRDSVRLLLGPVGTRPTVVMRGAWAGDSLVGEWRVEVGRTAGASGTFVMARHAAPARDR